MQSRDGWVRDSRLFPWSVAERPTLVAMSAAGNATEREVAYTARDHQRVLGAVSRGVKRRHAAAVAGICESTFERWYRKGKLIVELMEQETVVVDGVARPVGFPVGPMLSFYRLYLDLRQAEAMAVMEATNAVRKHVTGYVVPGEWVEEQESQYYAPPESDGTGGDPEWDEADPYKIKRIVKRLRWLSPTRVQGDGGMAWRVLQRLDPDPQGGAVTVNVDKSTSVVVDARKVEVYGFDLGEVAAREGLAGLRALVGAGEDLGELLEG